MHRWNCLFLTGLLIGMAGLTHAQKAQPPRVEIVLDLLEAFSPAQVKDSLSCEVRRPATAGGVRQNGLFEHPLNAERPARVDYTVDLPQIGTGERLLFAFGIALADGVDFDRPGVVVDGVRFAVAVDEKRLFEQDWRECRWQSYAVDLTALAGRRVRLWLLTDAIGTTNFDWAVWGSPRVLRFRGTALQANRLSLVTTGSLALSYRPGRKLQVRVRPLGGGEAVEWREPVSPRQTQGMQWAALDFNFPEAKGIEVEWEPKDALRLEQLWLAPYPPQLKLVRVSPVRAVPLSGEPVGLRVEVKNEGRGLLKEGAARLALWVGKQSYPERPLPVLTPGATWRTEYAWKAPPQPGRWKVTAQLKDEAGGPAWQRESQVETFSSLKGGQMHVLQNDHLRIEFVRNNEGYAYARVLGQQNGEWILAGVWRPLMRVVLAAQQGDVDWEIRPQQLTQDDGQKNAVELHQRSRDPQGAEWTARLRVTLEDDRPVARVRYEWTASQARQVKALWGPNLYVGDGTSGEAKTWGLLPGLEYLYGGEPSSNPRDFTPPLHDRRTPHPHKVTMPLMAVSVGRNSATMPDDAGRFFCPDSLKDIAEAPDPSAEEPPLTVALLWDPLQKWDGERSLPASRFASPNFDEGMSNHRMGLFLPSAPDFVPENADRAKEPYPLDANRTLTLDASLVVAPGPPTVALREWYRDVGGVPKPNPHPRSFEEELAVCRTGFLRTVWDNESQKWRHCIGWSPSHTPGFAALLWMDAHVTQNPDGRRQALERVELSVRNMLQDSGAGIFTSSANCHIMRWEFPFLYGYLPEALPALEPMIQNLIQSQQADGGWLFQPGDERRADLGQAGDSVLGTNTHNAVHLLRYARITGDSAALEAGEKALRFMEKFRVPRGGQTWECPMYEPDILPAGWAIAAYLEGYWTTGNPRWLHNAVYWAETGLPFIYQWSLPDRPMMLGAVIPVFGSTFYSHSWLMMPVQWCGLVYTYHLHRLAETLERVKLEAADSPLPVVLNLSPEEWKRVVELVTISGMYQQFDEGERIGAYPDSITNFEQRNPAFLNPEDILVNLLALKGYDPDIKTARLQTEERTVIISSGARVEHAQDADNQVRFRLRFFKGTPSHTLVVGWRPQEVRVNGQPLPRSAAPVRRDPGWWWDAERNRLYLTIMHSEETVKVEIVGER